MSICQQGQAGVESRKASGTGRIRSSKALEVRRHRTARLRTEAFAIFLIDDKGDGLWNSHLDSSSVSIVLIPILIH